MSRVLLGILITISLFASDNINKIIKLSNKGEKIARLLCDKDKLPPSKGSIDSIIIAIKNSKACPPLSKSKLEAVAYYLSNGAIKVSKNHLLVPSDAKCMVCGMFVSKYPKWASMMVVDGKDYYFDGVKDMMKYYIFDGDFIYSRDKIGQMLVSDYYTIEAIPAKEAFYVVGSTIFGPMGHELIAFGTLKSAKVFSSEHNGKEILKFGEITAKVLMRLDGVVVE
jgi:nitrous oxide reductase accessory protein NosL